MKWFELISAFTGLFACLGMVQHQQENQNDPFDWKRNFNLAFTLMLMHQRGIVVLTRKFWGGQALGISCFLALVMMFLWATFSRDPFMWTWLVVWFFVFVFRRYEASRVKTQVHSWYDGYPVGSIRLGRTEKGAKLIVEPLLIGGLGWGLYLIYQDQGWSPYGLPYFLLGGCFSLPFIEVVKQTIWERRIQGMQDAKIEQEAMMNDFRGR